MLNTKNSLHLSPVSNGAIETQKCPALNNLYYPRNHWTTEQARKITSALSLFPGEVSPTHRDAAITYHHQKVLVC